MFQASLRSGSLSLGSIVTLGACAILASCASPEETADGVFKFAGNLFGVGGTDITVNATVTDTSVLAKREKRPLVAVVAINDPDFATVVEQMCMNLGFQPKATGSEFNRIAQTKEDWFNELYSEVVDRNDLFAGADIVIAGYVPAFSKAGADASEVVQAETVLKAFDVGSAITIMITTAKLEASRGLSTLMERGSSTRLDTFSKMGDEIRHALLEKGFAGSTATLPVAR